MRWIKHGLKAGLVLSLIGGCVTMKSNPDRQSSGTSQSEDAMAAQQGSQRPKKRLAASRKVEWRQFQTKMSGLEQNARALSARISQASGGDSGKVDIQKRIEQLNADIAQLKQQTAASNGLAEEHKQKIAQLENEAKSLMDMLKMPK